MTEDEREALAQQIQTRLIGGRPTYQGDAYVDAPASRLAWEAVEVVEPYLEERERVLRIQLADDILSLPLFGEHGILRLAADVVLGKYRVRRQR